MAPKKRFRGRMSLVTISTAATLTAGCGPNNHIDDDLVRGRYNTKQECVADWGETSGRCTQTSTGSGTHFMGPYYSNAGRVYDQDGQVRSFSKPPANAASTMSPVKASSLSNHPAVVSRGGFGSGGRASFSGGG